MHPPEQFRTDRLLLRRVVADDVTALYETYTTDPEVTRFLSWTTHESPGQTQEFVDHAMTSWDDGSEFIWVLVPSDQNRPIGAVGAVAGPHGVEIGYVLAQQWWGRGLMSEAVETIMDWLKQQPGTYRIWAYCAAGHERSARVLQRAGMSYEALLRRWVVLPNFAKTPTDAKVFAWIRPDE